MDNNQKEVWPLAREVRFLLTYAVSRPEFLSRSGLDEEWLRRFLSGGVNLEELSRGKLLAIASGVDRPIDWIYQTARFRREDIDLLKA